MSGKASYPVSGDRKAFQAEKEQSRFAMYQNLGKHGTVSFSFLKEHADWHIKPTIGLTLSFPLQIATCVPASHLAGSGTRGPPLRTIEDTPAGVQGRNQPLRSDSLLPGGRPAVPW